MRPLRSFYELIEVAVDADKHHIDRRTRELLDILQHEGRWARFLAALRGRGSAKIKGVRDVLLDSERRREYDEHWKEVTGPDAPGFPWL